MTKQAADILRRKRRECLSDAASEDERAKLLEGNAKGARVHAQNLRELHVQLGNAIRMIEGDGAVLDLPPESFS